MAEGSAPLTDKSSFSSECQSCQIIQGNSKSQPSKTLFQTLHSTKQLG